MSKDDQYTPLLVYRYNIWNALTPISATGIEYVRFVFMHVLARSNSGFGGFDYS